MPSVSAAREGERVLRLCSVCMYCDGLCPVFSPLSAMRAYPAAELAYLANLCHGCRACWHACQYAPPHPFAVNVPAVLARLRVESYADHARPRFLGAAFLQPALGAALVALAAVAAMLVLTAAAGPALWRAHTGPGALYAVAPWATLASLAAGSLTWAVACVGLSTRDFWRAVAAGVPRRALAAGLGSALADVVTLRRLDGGGPGCNDVGPRFSRQRRIWHLVMAAGVVLDVVATGAATLEQDVLGRLPPYPLASVPVSAGVVGGLAILVGAAGLLGLEARADRAPSDRAETGLNVVFLSLLGFAALSGLAVLAWRETAAMGPLLVLHVGTVIGLFVGLPASKFIHAPFRAAALLRANAERR